MSKVPNINILAIETSSHACSAAVLQKEQEDIEICEVYQDAPRQHNVLIIPMLEEVLAKSGCQLSDMDVLAFGRGPGAFTGVRVATSVIQAIGYATDIKIAPVSSLAALAQGIYRLSGETQLLVANDARMNEVYAGAYQNKNGFMFEVAPETVAIPQELEKNYLDAIQSNGIWKAVGSGWNVYRDDLQSLLDKDFISELKIELLPHAQDIAYLALQNIKNNQLYPASQVVPVYLRDNVAKKSANQKT